jgi:hypothetical protein
LPQNTISWRGKPVRPRMEKRDSGAAPLCRRSFEVFRAPENLHASTTKRSAEHPVRRQENGLEIAREERASGCVFQEVWRSGTRFHLIPAGQWLRSRGHSVRLKAEPLWSSFSGAFLLNAVDAVAEVIPLGTLRLGISRPIVRHAHACRTHPIG